jgi:hypothetical protein
MKRQTRSSVIAALTVFALAGVAAPSPAAAGIVTFTNYTFTDGQGNNLIQDVQANAVQEVYAVGSTIYAATGGGLRISTNSGANFTNYTTTDGLGSNIVRGVYAVGSTIYAATQGGLSISTDSGANFTNYRRRNGLGNDNVFGVYAVGSTIYAATQGGLGISTNSGANFTNYTTTNGLGNNFVVGVYASGSTVYAATSGGLSISTNSGANFTNYTTTDGLGSNIVLGVYAVGSTIYAATQGGLGISTNGGTSFTNYNSSNGLGGITVNNVYAVGSTIYAATNDGLSISTNGGTSFTNYNFTNGLGSSYVNGVYASGSTIYAATGGGLSIATTAAVPEIDPGTGGSALSLVAGVLAMIEQRRRRGIALAALTVFALAGAATPSFAGITYNITNDLTHQNGWSLAGTITASGVGEITNASAIAITAWDITATQSSVSHRYSNTTSTATPGWLLFGNLNATSTTLSLATGSRFLFTEEPTNKKTTITWSNQYYVEGPGVLNEYFARVNHQSLWSSITNPPFSPIVGDAWTLGTRSAAVPEIDPATGGSALSLVAGVLAIIEQRRRRGIALAALTVFALAGAATPSFAGITYNVTNYTQVQNGWSVAGTITVSGTGTFTNASAITAWDVTVSKPNTGSYQFTNTLSGHGGRNFVGTLTASPVTLELSSNSVFNFNSETYSDHITWSPSDPNYSATIGNVRRWWVEDGFSPSNNGVWTIGTATPSGVPEIDPGTGGSALSLVAGVLAMIEQRRRRSTLVA